jgi:hypothetical protein
MSRVCSRKRHDGDREQEQGIEEENTVAGVLDESKHVVMVHPHDADDRKTCEERDVRRPLARESGPQGARLEIVW